MEKKPDPLPSGTWHLDAAPDLAGLVALVGPANRAEFLARLQDDLTRAARDLAADDPAVQKRGAHVLMGLAGTLGAKDMQAEARLASRALKDGVSPEPLPLAAAVLALVADLAALGSG